MKRLALAVFTAVGLVVGVSLSAVFAQQERDDGFDTKVARPAYTDRHPAVLFDEAHNNYHTTRGRYKPFVDLITSDGYRVTANTQKFAPGVFKEYQVLVIASAMGAAAADSSSPQVASSAFSAAECDAVRDWVDGGGSLLLVTDAPPWGAPAAELVARFGVESSKLTTFDRQNSDGVNASRLFFTRASGLLADHPTTQGRESAERVSRVLTFAGQSLKGPARSVALLKLSDAALDRKVDAKGNSTDGQAVSAAGRAQGLALTQGKGRVIILGEAGLLTAQVTGPMRKPMGMNVPGVDNRQFALNLMHWLSNLLDPPAAAATAPAVAATPPSQPAPAPARAPGGTLSTAEIVAESVPSVALVKSKVGGSGSGFLVRPGLLATNAHVLEGEFIGSMEIHFPSADEGKKGPHAAELVYEDVKRDLALLAVNTTLPPLRIAPSYSFRRGEDITVIGNPGRDDDVVLENAISRGVMSTRTKIEGQDYYQLGVAINPGNSGGPVFDSTGQVIGIATRASARKESLAYSIPVDELQAAIEKQARQSPEQSRRVASQHRLLSAVQCLGGGGAWYSLGIEFRRPPAGRVPAKKNAAKIAQKSAQRFTRAISELERDWFRIMEAELPAIRDDTLVDRPMHDKFVALCDSFARLKAAYKSDRPGDLKPEDLRTMRATHRKLTVNLYDALKVEVPTGLLAVFEEDALARFSGVIPTKRAGGLQRADVDFDTEVARPAYTAEHPRVFIDEAHHNFLTAGGRYKPIADLLTSDGYKVAPGANPFTRDVLAGCDVLVVANAMGGAAQADAGKPAFTRDECAAVGQWVKEGGALLLISDQPPWGAASAELAASLGVATSQGVTFDPANRVDSGPGRLLFSRENKLLGDHPILEGRDGSERINRVMTFIGQSLKGPAGSTSLLQLADTALDRIDVNEIPAKGRSQGVAFTLGKGRVVVLGDGAQLSAQVTGPLSSRVGMSVLDCDNRQWALNIMHWLSGVLGR
jgi:S1-C subfamily serine protease